MIKVEDGGLKFFDTPIRIWQITRRRSSEDSNVLGAELSGASVYCRPQNSVKPQAFPRTSSHTFCF